MCSRYNRDIPNNPVRDAFEGEPGMIPIVDAMRRVASGDLDSLTVPVDSHLNTSRGRRVGLQIRLAMLSEKLKIESRLVVAKGHPPKGTVTISSPKQRSMP